MSKKRPDKTSSPQQPSGALEAVPLEARLLAALMDHIPDNIYFKDVKSRFTLINRSLASLFKLKDPSEAVGKTDFDFFTREHASRAFEDEQELMRTGEPVMNIEEEETWPDGHVTWVSTTKMPLYDEDRVLIGTFGISRNISRRKEAEIRLEESEARLRTLIEMAPDIIYRVDPRGRILFVSQVVEELLGYAPEELTGRPFLDLVHPDDLEKCRRRLTRGRRDERSKRALEVRIRRKDITRRRGGDPWIHMSISTRGVWDEAGRRGDRRAKAFLGTEGIMRDITERKRSEDELLKYRENLEGLVAERTAELRTSNNQLQREIRERGRVEEAVRVERDKAQMYLDIAGAIIVVLDRDAKITLINRAGCENLGYDERDILGKNWFATCVPPQVRDEVRAVFDRMMAGEFTPLEYYENEILTKNGERRMAAWHNALLRDEAGRIVGTLSSGEDITQRKRAEEALLQTERLEAIGSLAGGVAANFNNILSVISGYASSIAVNVVPESPMHAGARRILEATRHAGELTKGLLRLAQASSAHRETMTEAVSLGRVVSDVIGFLEPSFSDRGVRFRTIGVDGMPYVRGNQSLLFDVLIALCLNASEAMPDGGTITVDAAVKLVRKPSVKLSPETEGGHFAVLRVRDGGTGIAKEHLGRIFEPFFTTRSDKGAFGVGLAFVQTTVRSMGGWVVVRSKKGSGSSFRLFLPKAAVTSVPRPEDTAAATAGKTVLVVDDASETLTMIQDTLKSAGFRVLAAENVEKGLLLYRDHADGISLSVVDTVMREGKGGDHLVEEIIKHAPQANVIMTSGFSRDYVRGLVPRGAWGFLQKPFSGEQLLAAIRDAMAKRAASGMDKSRK